jgi:chromate transport protein ChrA
MTRQEIENKLVSLRADIISRIEKEPLKSSVFALICGVILTLFQAFFVPLIVIAAVLTFGLWFISDQSIEDSADAPHGNKGTERSDKSK